MFKFVEDGTLTALEVGARIRTTPETKEEGGQSNVISTVDDKNKGAVYRLIAKDESTGWAIIDVDASDLNTVNNRLGFVKTERLVSIGFKRYPLLTLSAALDALVNEVISRTAQGIAKTGE